MINPGNLVNRIGLQRRYRNIAIFIAVVMFGVAWVGWIRPVKVIAERPVSNGISNECMSWCEEQGD